MITKEILDLIDMINVRIICILISLFGIVTNICNIIVFNSCQDETILNSDFRQGYSDSINISLLGLTLSDLGGVITSLWCFTYNHPLLLKWVNVLYVPEDLIYMTAGPLHLYFAKLTCCITIWITIQRCLCIVLPLQVNRILTLRRTGFVIVCLYIAAFFLSVCADHCTGQVLLGWKFVPRLNKTLFGMIVTDQFQTISNNGFIQHTVLTLASLASILASTIILSILLRQKTKWRRDKALVGTSKVSKRNERLGVMVVTLSIIQIVCFIPSASLVSFELFLPDFTLSGKFFKSVIVSWSFGSTLEAANSSVNVFVYYSMSSKYRNTFRQLFCKNSKTKNKNYD